MGLLLSAVLALSGCEQLAGGVASEAAERNRAYREGFNAYEKGDFTALEALFDQEDGKRTPSGIWRIGVMYAGMRGAIGETASEAQFRAAEGKAAAWLAAKPHSSYAPIALAAVYQAKACSCDRRGQKRLTPAEAQAWRLKAYTVLLRQPANLVPEHYNQALQLADAIGYDEAVVEKHYRNGVRRQPPYFPTRFAWVSYLARQPDGAKRVERAARETLAEYPFPERDSLYARMLWWAAQDRYGDELFERVPVDWPTFDKSFSAILARFPDDWNRNHYARFACLAGHQDRAREVMRDHEVLLSVWASRDEFNACLG